MPHHFASPAGWTQVVFRPGSGGSSVTGSGGLNKFYVITGSESAVEFTNLDEDFVYIDNGAAKVTGGKTVQVDYLQGGRSFVASDVKALSLQMQEGQVYSGAMTVSRCESVFFDLVLGANAQRQTQ